MNPLIGCPVYTYTHKLYTHKQNKLSKLYLYTFVYVYKCICNENNKIVRGNQLRVRETWLRYVGLKMRNTSRPRSSSLMERRVNLNFFLEAYEKPVTRLALVRSSHQHCLKLLALVWVNQKLQFSLSINSRCSISRTTWSNTWRWFLRKKSGHCWQKADSMSDYKATDIY